MTIIERATEIAYEYIGVPYAWGGFSKAGIDCSGLVYQCYYGDLDMIRGDTDALARDSHFADCTQDGAREGAIVLLEGNDPAHEWQHVGYYLGNGRVIHAPTFGQPVREDALGTFLRWCTGAALFRNFIEALPDPYTGVAQVEPNLTESQLVRIEGAGDGWSIIRFANGNVLDVKGGTAAGAVLDGREVQQHAENGTDAQLWRFEDCGIEGAYWIVPKIATSKALDVCHGITGRRGNTQLHGKQPAMENRWAQAWRTVPTIREGWSMLVNAKSGYALDANPGGKDYS